MLAHCSSCFVYFANKTDQQFDFLLWSWLTKFLSTLLFWCQFYFSIRCNNVINNARKFENGNPYRYGTALNCYYKSGAKSTEFSFSFLLSMSWFLCLELCRIHYIIITPQKNLITIRHLCFDFKTTSCLYLLECYFKAWAREFRSPISVHCSSWRFSYVELTYSVY